MSKEKRIQFILDHGFKSVTAFAEEAGEHPSNVHKVLAGVQIPKIQKLLNYAAILNVDIAKLLELFYPEEMKQYKAARKEARHGRK